MPRPGSAHCRPRNRYNSMATHRIYYDDAFEKEFTARILSCEPALILPSPEAKAPAWEVILDRTAFYPTSGGQPHDVGKLGDASVFDVRDDGGEIVHLVDRPLESGEVQGCINWPRRFDHMEQHTGQHLLSAMFQERFGLPTVSFHLGAEICTIDLRGPGPTDETLEGAERAANQVIFEDRPVNVRYGTAEQFAELGVRKEVEREGILRAIEIEGADLQPCGGTHVKRTGQIGTLLVRRCAKVRQDWRVEFLCGGRAERIARNDFLRLRQAAEKLTCAPDEIVGAAERALAERDANFKNLRVMLERLAKAEAALTLQSTPSAPNGLRVIARVLEGVPAEYLGFFATAITKSEKTVALLAATDGGHLHFAQHPSARKNMNALLKEVLEKLGGKGGGTPDFARGKLADPAKTQRALDAAKSLL
jgi:alanyl-tRNA synthetase